MRWVTPTAAAVPIPEPRPKARSEFQRDRDRIVHSTAFRRLEYKTQVFVNHEGDLFRTRLTHSIEVAQIARSIARALRLNDDLAEAIALAHDLGHTPFGHAGQDALNECMQGHFGGFEHNLQSLRIVDGSKSATAPSMASTSCSKRARAFSSIARRRERASSAKSASAFLEGRQPSLEAQICNLADEIAYNNHDVDDGLRSGLLTLEQLEGVSLFARHAAEADAEFPQISSRRRVHETIRRVIDAQVTDLLAESARKIAAAGPESLATCIPRQPLIAFTDAMHVENRALKGSCATTCISISRCCA
jgi:dGTPase